MQENYLVFRVDLTQLANKQLSNTFEIHFDFSNDKLKHYIHNTIFILNCLPFINVFDKTSDPIRISKDQSEYLLAIDKTNPNKYCINNLKQVFITCKEEIIEAKKTLGIFAEENYQKHVLWSLKPSHDKEYLITLMTKNTDIINQTINFHVTAEVSEGQTPIWLLNKYKEKLEYTLEDTTIEIDNITYIDSSKEVHQKIFKDSQEELISHLQLNSLNLVKEEDAENIYKKIMQIYCDQDNSYGQKLIQSVDKISIHEVTKRQTINKYNKHFYIEDLM